MAEKEYQSGWPDARLSLPDIPNAGGLLDAARNYVAPEWTLESSGLSLVIDPDAMRRIDFTGQGRGDLDQSGAGFFHSGDGYQNGGPGEDPSIKSLLKPGVPYPGGQTANLLGCLVNTYPGLIGAISSTHDSVRSHILTDPHMQNQAVDVKTHRRRATEPMYTCKRGQAVTVRPGRSSPQLSGCSPGLRRAWNMRAATALVLALPAHAAPAKRPATTCASLPEPVRAYLRSDPQWKVVDIGDLDREDQQSWLENSGHACPGLAVVKLDGSGKTSYGVAQLRGQGSKFQEKIVILQATDKDNRRVTLLEPFGDAPVHVI
jgi:hypothetical protein